MNPSQNLVPLRVVDISLFCKNLRTQLLEKQVAALPTHVVLLNLIAKSAGYRNYQALRADANFADAQIAPQPLILSRDLSMDLSKAIQRALGHFDTHARLIRFPLQLSVRQIALLGVWCRLPLKRDLSEREVNDYIADAHTFADNATLRRELVNMKLLWRTKDGRVYRRLPATTSADGALFLKTLMKMTRTRPLR